MDELNQKIKKCVMECLDRGIKPSNLATKLQIYARKLEIYEIMSQIDSHNHTHIKKFFDNIFK